MSTGMNEATRCFAIGFAHGNIAQGDTRIEVEDTAEFAREFIAVGAPWSSIAKVYNEFADRKAAEVDAAQQAYEVAS